MSRAGEGGSNKREREKEREIDDASILPISSPIARIPFLPSLLPPPPLPFFLFLFFLPSFLLFFSFFFNYSFLSYDISIYPLLLLSLSLLRVSFSLPPGDKPEVSRWHQVGPV